MAIETYNGNPEFPKTPDEVLPGASTNDTDVYYILDTLNKDVVIADMLDEDGATSAFANQTLNGRIYGRFKKIVVNASSANNLLAYKLDPGHSSQ